MQNGLKLFVACLCGNVVACCASIYLYQASIFYLMVALVFHGNNNDGVKFVQITTATYSLKLLLVAKNMLLFYT